MKVPEPRFANLGPTDRSAATIWLFLLATVGLIHFIHAFSMPSPIYGGDEYSYLASGLFNSSLAELWQRDPYMPRIANPMFLALIKLAGNFFSDPASIIRVLNVFAVIAFIGFATWYVAISSSNRRAMVAIFPLGLLPSAGYVVAVMPESMFYAAATGAPLALVMLMLKRPVAAGFVSGALSATAFLLKPHAISLMVGEVVSMLALILLMMFLKLERRRNGLLVTLLTYLISTYVCIVVLSSVFTGNLALNPGSALGALYKGIGRESLSSIGSGIGVIIYYFIGNVSCILLFSFPFVGLMTLKTFDVLYSRPISRPDLQFVMLFSTVLCVGVATLAMASIFTYSAGVASLSEAMRLHGRYYAYLYVLIIAGGSSVSDWQSTLAKTRLPHFDGYRLIGVGWLILGVYFLYVVWQFRIYPWDNPELSAFYRLSISSWKWDGGISWSAWVAALALGMCALAFVFRARYIFSLLAMTITAVFVLANINNARWQRSVSANTSFLTDTGRFTHALFKRDEDSKVLIVGAERYGSMSYVLFGIACQCRVFVPGVGEPLSIRDVASDVKYIFSVRSYPVAFSTKSLFTSPGGTFHEIEIGER